MRINREAYGLHSCTWMLSNHESLLRSERFATKKIISDLNKVQKGNLECNKLGNLNVVRDWGWAYEYAKIYNKSRIFANILLYVVGPVSFLEALNCGCITISFPTRFLLEHVSDKAKKFSLLLNKSVLDFQIYIIKFLENYVPLDDFIMNLGLKFLENAKFENLALELERIADLNISNPKRANSFFIKNKKK